MAPIPFATFINRGWSNIGANYTKGLAAVSFQGFLMLVCLGIYGALITTVPDGATTASEILANMWVVQGYSVLLIIILRRTEALSKSDFQLLKFFSGGFVDVFAENRHNFMLKNQGFVDNNIFASLQTSSF